MKKLIVLLFFAQLISLTQTAQVKQAADACPGANKNNRTSKDYAHLSNRSAAKSTSDFSKPKYQHLYAHWILPTDKTRMLYYPNTFLNFAQLVS